MPGTELAIIPKEPQRGRHRRPKPPRAMPADAARAFSREMLVLLSRLQIRLRRGHGGH